MGIVDVQTVDNSAPGAGAQNYPQLVPTFHSKFHQGFASDKSL